jgi:hypothetical protein
MPIKKHLCKCGHGKSFHWEKSGCSQCACTAYQPRQRVLFPQTPPEPAK